MRAAAGLSVTRMCELAGIHRSTWYRWAARARDGRPARGRWPTAVRDRIDVPARDMALAGPAWGHRKIWALLVADGHQASQATVRRALRARALLQPAGATRDAASSHARDNAFVDLPARRNRVWQTDFSELETLGQVWQLGGLVDYVAKVCLACPVTATKTWRDAIGVARGRPRPRAGVDRPQPARGLH